MVELSCVHQSYLLFSWCLWCLQLNVLVPEANFFFFCNRVNHLEVEKAWYINYIHSVSCCCVSLTSSQVTSAIRPVGKSATPQKKTTFLEVAQTIDSNSNKSDVSIRELRTNMILDKEGSAVKKTDSDFAVRKTSLTCKTSARMALQ